MQPLKKILWPTDFSGPSYDAPKVTKELAEHFYEKLVRISPFPTLVIRRPSENNGKK